MLVTNLKVKKGMKNAEVKMYQELLLKAGCSLPRWGADSSFGDECTEATRDFQRRHGLVIDGFVGVNTLYELMFYDYPNFKKSEFACKCGKYCSGHPVKVDEDLLVMLTKVRNHFGKAVHITSAIRCKQHNKNVGGASNSQHLYGTACDIKVSGVLPSVVYAYCNTINLNGGVGKYNTFTHIDTRKGRSRWNG
jgi:hypothetical protein